MTASLRHATKTFGTVRAVDDVSFEVDRGEVVGLLGANGAGKTTAIRMMLGLVAPTAGDVEIFGRPASRDSLRRVGYVPQGLGLYTDLTGEENMAFQAGVYGFAAPDPSPDLETWWRVPTERMPLGVRRRVAFEVALAHRPDLLVLDEPTSGVGPLGRARLWDAIHDSAERGAGVLVSTHHLDEAEQCDRLVMMAAGRVVAAGTIEQVTQGGSAVTVTTGDWRTAMRALGTMTTTLTAHGLRVAGGDPDLIRRRLVAAGVVAEVAIEAATLEETFVRVSR